MKSFLNNIHDNFTVENLFTPKKAFIFGFIILVVNFLFYYCSSPSEGNKIGTSTWWSNFGQSYGIAAAILSFLNILLIVYTVQQQNKYNQQQDYENKKQDENQRQKVETLKSQVQLTAELSSLDVFVNTFKDRLDVRRKELDESSDTVEEHANEEEKTKKLEKSLKLKSELNKLESFVENLRHEISDKYNSVESRESALYTKKEFPNEPTNDQIQKIIKVCSEFSTHEQVNLGAIIPQDIKAKVPINILEKYDLSNLKHHKSFFEICIKECYCDKKIDTILESIKKYFKGEEIKTKIMKTCKRISIHEGIPACAIIPKDILDYLITHRQDNQDEKLNENERLKFLKHHKSFFAKWINDCFNNYDIEKILKDVEHYYEIDRGMPYGKEGEKFKNVCATLFKLIENKSKDFYETQELNNEHVSKYPSNPFFHRSQVFQIASQWTTIKCIEHLKNLKWKTTESTTTFNVLSELQSSSKIVENIFIELLIIKIREFLIENKQTNNMWLFDEEQLPEIAKNIYFKKIKSLIDLKGYIKKFKYDKFLNLDDLVSNLYNQIESFTKTT